MAKVSAAIASAVMAPAKEAAMKVGSAAEARMVVSLEVVTALAATEVLTAVETMEELLSGIIVRQAAMATGVTVMVVEKAAASVVEATGMTTWGVIMATEGVLSGAIVQEGAMVQVVTMEVAPPAAMPVLAEMLEEKTVVLAEQVMMD